jgi:PhnB protein
MREAMTFLKSALGGDLSLLPVKDSPMKDMFPAARSRILFYMPTLPNGDLSLLGSDMPTRIRQQIVGLVSLT